MKTRIFEACVSVLAIVLVSAVFAYGVTAHFSRPVVFKSTSTGKVVKCEDSKGNDIPFKSVTGTYELVWVK